MGGTDQGWSAGRHPVETQNAVLLVRSLAFRTVTPMQRTRLPLIAATLLTIVVLSGCGSGSSTTAPEGQGQTSQPASPDGATGGTGASNTPSGDPTRPLRPPAPIAPGSTGRTPVDADETTGRPETPTPQTETDAATRSEIEKIIETALISSSWGDAPGALPVDQRIAYLQYGEEMLPLVVATERNSGSSQFPVPRVRQVVLPDPETRERDCVSRVDVPECAQVTMAYDSQDGQTIVRRYVAWVVKEDGQWKMSKRSVCVVISRLAIRCPDMPASWMADLLE